MVTNSGFVTTDAIKSLAEETADEIFKLYEIALASSRITKEAYRNTWRSRKGVRYDRWK